jgi:hypothetical protein
MYPRRNSLMPVCHAPPIIELALQVEQYLVGPAMAGSRPGLGSADRGSNDTHVARRSDCAHRVQSAVLGLR